MDAIEKTNWLAHRWPIETEIRPYGQWDIFTAKIEGQRVGQRGSKQEYDQWLERARPSCLARFIAGRLSLHPAAVLITSGTWRLGRIPAELWCGYDVTELLDLPAVTLLSAKVRAMFPAWPRGSDPGRARSEAGSTRSQAGARSARLATADRGLMAHYDADGGQVPTTLFECAAFQPAYQPRRMPPSVHQCSATT